MFIKPLLILILIGRVSPDGGAGIAERDVDAPFVIQAAEKADDSPFLPFREPQGSPFHQGKTADPFYVWPGKVPQQPFVASAELLDLAVGMEKVPCHAGRSPSMNRSIGSSSAPSIMPIGSSLAPSIMPMTGCTILPL